MMNTLLQDLRYGARMFMKKPGFTWIAVITLSLGIGANTAIFSVVNAVLLRPLPFQNPEQLFTLWERNPKQGYEQNPPAAGNYLDWQAQNQVFAQMAIEAPLVFVINETMARRFFPNEDPLGKRMKVGFSDLTGEIVGIVGDVKHASLDAEVKQEIYTSYDQTPFTCY